MKQITLVAIVALIATVAFYNHNSTQDEPVLSSSSNAECTKTLEIECAVDIEKTVKACATAFETGGADIIADIKCTRDLMSDKKHCWPCICAMAKKEHWHIIGC